MNFKRTTKRYDGSLQTYVTVKTSEVIERFGQPDADGYYEPERGYDGLDFTFENEAGETVSLYARWGSYRVGAADFELAAEFVKWLFFVPADMPSPAKPVDLEQYQRLQLMHAAIG